MSFFEHIAATDDSERVARRKASVIAAQRFQNQFGAFLKGASSKEDFQARLALIDSDIKEMTYDVAEEYGGDPQVIESAVRRHFLGAAHTVEERDGEYFVVEDGGTETVAGPFDERQEAQDRASELDELEPLEKKEAAMDNEQWRQAIEGLLSDIESMYGKTPSDAEYLSGSSAAEDLLSGLRDFVEYGYQGPNPAQTIKGIFSDLYSVWGGSELAYDSIVSYVSGVFEDGFDGVFEDLYSILGGYGDEHYSSNQKIAVRRPKMCPYHSELTEASLQSGEPQYAAFSALVGGDSHCKGGFEGKCNFKPEMVTQEYWDKKAQDAAERKQLREQQQQEVVEIAEEPIIEEPVAENTELTDELSEAPSAVGEMSLDDSPAEIAEEAMAMTASAIEVTGDEGESVIIPSEYVESWVADNLEGYLEEEHGMSIDDVEFSVNENGILVSSSNGNFTLDLDILKDWLYEESDTISEEFLNGDTWDGNFRVANQSNTTPKGAELNRYRSRGISDTPVKPGDRTEGLTGEEITGAGIPIDQNIDHQLTEEEVRRIHLMREKAAKFASLKQAKDCDCWKGYKRVPGTEPCAPGSCEKCDNSKKSNRYHSILGGPDEPFDQLMTIYDELTQLSAETNSAELETALNEAARLIGEAMPLAEEGGDGFDYTASRLKQSNYPITDEHKQKIKEEIDRRGGRASNDDCMNIADDICMSMDPDGDGADTPWDEIYQMAKDYNAYVEHQNREVPHNPFEASRRQAEVAWDGGGATKNERGTWAWGHQEPKADESGLDDAPSGPAMDKTRWQPAALDPNGKGNLKPVDTEYPGSPNPTIQQVLWERREDEDVYGQQEFGDGINSVTDKQELPAADETGLTTEKNLDQGSQGGTFPNEGQANPVTSKVANEESECLDCHPEDPCEGSVEPRMPLSGTGRSFPRCEKHWEQRVQKQDEINQRYPYNAPSDFDPGYAGERWDDEY